MTAEVEEVLEEKLVGLLSPLPIPVGGVLIPVAPGEAKVMSGETYCIVNVDQSSQDGDFRTAVRNTYAAEVRLVYAMADSKSGEEFRDCCRATRERLTALTGDGCASLDASGFGCSSVMLDSTSTTFEDGDSPRFVKTYSLTIVGIVG